jgi:hypothetical protein
MIRIYAKSKQVTNKLDKCYLSSENAIQDLSLVSTIRALTKIGFSGNYIPMNNEFLCSMMTDLYDIDICRVF